MKGIESTGWQVANEVSINSNINSSIDCSLHCKNCNRKWKFATGNRN